MVKIVLAMSLPIYKRKQENDGTRDEIDEIRIGLTTWDSKITPFVVHELGLGKDGNILNRERGTYCKSIFDAVKSFRERCRGYCKKVDKEIDFTKVEDLSHA